MKKIRNRSSASWGDYYKSNNVEELEETRRIYMKMTPGLPLVTVKSIENVIQDDRDLSGLGLRPEEMLDLSFLQKLEEEKRERALTNFGFWIEGSRIKDLNPDFNRQTFIHTW